MIQKEIAKIVGLNGFPIVINVGIDLFESIKKVKQLEVLINDNNINDGGIKTIIHDSIAKIYQDNGISYKRNSFINDMQDEFEVSLKIHFELETLKAYLHGFEPHGNCQFPPKIISFTLEAGQKLKSANVMWTLNSSAVKGKVRSMLEKGESFIFYRNGPFAGIKKCPKQARGIIFKELCLDHYFLVVGDDSGLEEDLQNDIKIVAALANVTKNDLQSLLESKHNGNYYRSYGKNGVFTLLIKPKSVILKKTLTNLIQNCPNFFTHYHL